MPCVDSTAPLLDASPQAGAPLVLGSLDHWSRLVRNAFCWSPGIFSHHLRSSSGVSTIFILLGTFLMFVSQNDRWRAISASASPGVIFVFQHCNLFFMLWWIYGEYKASGGIYLMPDVATWHPCDSTCTHRGLKVGGIVPNHKKSPVCPNCFLFVSRDHQRSFLEDLAKCRADLRFL